MTLRPYRVTVAIGRKGPMGDVTPEAQAARAEAFAASMQAGSAQSAAETARTQSQTARDASVAAQLAAQAARDEAVVSRDAILLLQDGADAYVEATLAAAIAAGLAGTTAGDPFTATGDDVGYIGLYRHDAGPAATELYRTPKTTFIEDEIGFRRALIDDSEDGIVQITDAAIFPGMVISTASVTMAGADFKPLAFPDIGFDVTDDQGLPLLRQDGFRLILPGADLAPATFEDQVGTIADPHGTPLLSPDPSQGVVGRALDPLIQPVAADFQHPAPVSAVGGYLRARDWQRPETPSPYVRTGGRVVYNLSDAYFGQPVTIAMVPAVSVIGGRIFAAAWNHVETGLGSPNGEWPRSFLTIFKSDDLGATWQKCFYITADPAVTNGRVSDATMVAHNGQLFIRYLHHAAKFGGTGGIYDRFDAAWGLWIRNPLADPEHMVCSEPFYTGLGFPTSIFHARGQIWATRYAGTGGPALSNGLPAELTGRFIDRFHPEHDYWEPIIRIPQEAEALWNFPEPQVVEIRGNRLLCLQRTSDGLYKSVLENGAWSAPAAFTGVTPSATSKCLLKRTPSGRLLLVLNNAENRTKMTACLSEDDGETWPVGMRVELFAGLCSYPVADFDDAGNVYVVHDLRGTSPGGILCHRFSETSLIAGIPAVNTTTVQGL